MSHVKFPFKWDPILCQWSSRIPNLTFGVPVPPSRVCPEMGYTFDQLDMLGQLAKAEARESLGMGPL